MYGNTDFSFQIAYLNYKSESPLFLDFGAMLYQQYNMSLDECPDFRLHQECKPAYLLATGQLTKDKIEIPLEVFLGKVFKNQDIQIFAEPIENTSDKWKINVGSDGEL